MATYQTKGRADDLVRPIISANDVGAHVEAALYDVLHDDVATPSEKRAALGVLAYLAQTLSVTWGHRMDGYGGTSEALFYRLCGLTGTGEVPMDILDRIEPVEADSGPLAASDEEADDA